MPKHPHRTVIRYCQAVKTMAGGLQLSGHTHGGQVMIPGVPVSAFTIAPQILGAALGAIHAKRLCQGGATLEWAQASIR